ncbi:hypothetical protein TrVE_jg745 [Triparma verrucosa]|uniref:Uncharacterized protein n=1 Tax=Triparma verrucosa TaxID=1606542 RepID=A0A9W7BHJ2_9STRA|nr:hypothetical protein TrVE_jg745 [Triparma verrucosa]
MPWILQIMGLQKNNLTFTDTEGNVVKMVKPEPKWVKALKNPINAFKKKKADFLKNNSYGKPGAYIDNPEMFQELVEECTSSSIGLQTIHDCLSQKLDPNLPFLKHKNNRAMHYAARHGSVYMAMMLLKAGAKISPRNSLGQTPLHVAASGRLPHHTAFLRWVIAKEGVDINEKDRGGNTALVLAVISCARTNVGILLHHKAIVTVTTKKLLTYEDPEALAIAKYVRAVDNRLDIEVAEEYFEVQKFLGPSIFDRVFGMGLCSESHYVVEMCERALDGNYLNYYEIHKENLKRGLTYLFYRYVLGRKPVKEVVRKKKKVLAVQKASEEDMNLLVEAKLRKRELKKQQYKEEIKIRNLEAARREIAAVQSKDTLARLYGKTKGGAWVRQTEDELAKKRGFDDKKKIKVEPGGRAETKSRWEFREIEGDKSLGNGLDIDKFIGYDLLKNGDKTLDELKEEKAIARLAADLEFLEGKKISELEFHQKDFRVGGLNTLKSRDGARYKNGQRVSVVSDAEFLKKGMRREDIKDGGGGGGGERRVTGLRQFEGEEKTRTKTKKGGLMSKFSFSTGWAKLAPGEEIEPPRERPEDEEEDEVMEIPEERRQRKKEKKREKKRMKKEKKKKRKEDEKKGCVEERDDSDDWSD